MSDNKQYTEEPTCPKCGTEVIFDIFYGSSSELLEFEFKFECKKCKTIYISQMVTKWENEVKENEVKK